MEDQRKWLDAIFGAEGAILPPPLSSERIKKLMGQALLRPGSLTPDQVQELAASALHHLMTTKAAT